MSRQEAMDQYMIALRQGKRYYNECVVRGEYPYPQVLGEILTKGMEAGRVPMGLVNIPADQIVGTATAGRKSAFAGNFMPLFGVKSEFAAKWVNLCEAHLSPRGVTDPIICYEFMGRFYVVEGNKRVSVYKSYGAPTIVGTVTRIVPVYSDDPKVQIYYEFMNFYQLASIYEVWFSHLGDYTRLLNLLGKAKDHVWTDDERTDFLSGFRRFRACYDRMNTERLPLTAGDALLQWLTVYSFSDLNVETEEINRRLAAIWPDLRIQANRSPIMLSTAAQAEGGAHPIIPRLLGIGRINHLNIAFIHAFDPKKSAWTAAHELGRKHLMDALGSRITVKAYQCGADNALPVMEQAVAEGAQVIFATTPPLIGACHQIAVRYPQVRVLACSLSVPYAGVRSYYSRIHECKFITGAIAGAMATEDAIGYVANYPIIGMTAAINAFALGVRLTNPRARIRLLWSCLPGNPIEAFQREGISVISNRDGLSENPQFAWDWGTYKIEEDGVMMPLASPHWNWGEFYEKVVLSIFNGTWDDLQQDQKAVNYWWGMSSGVLDVTLSDLLPNGVRQLAEILKRGLTDGSIDPFARRLRDQSGQIRNDGLRKLTPEEIMRMDWLCDSVDGYIPRLGEILPASQELVRLLGVYREDGLSGQEGAKM